MKVHSPSRAGVTAKTMQLENSVAKKTEGELSDLWVGNYPNSRVAKCTRAGSGDPTLKGRCFPPG